MRVLTLCCALAAASPVAAQTEGLYGDVEQLDEPSGAAGGAEAEAVVDGATPDLYGEVEHAPGSAASTTVDLGFTDVGLKWGGAIGSNLHYRLVRRTVGEFYDQKELAEGFSRVENTLTLEVNVTAGPISGVADVDLDWIAHRDTVQSLGDLALHQSIDPVRLEARALYVQGTDLLVDGLDLRIGQQVVAWGVGDQFNPTNTINPTDLDDVLRFGEQIGNFMVRGDYALPLGDLWSVSAIFVPVFKPALTPTTAELALTNPNRLPFVDSQLRYRLHAEKVLANRLGVPTVVEGVTVRLPAPDIRNSQAALRLAGTVADQDVALSYYYGRFDFPVAVKNHTRQDSVSQCDPDRPERCIQGRLATNVELAYPRIQVIGLNVSGELDILRWIHNRAPPLGYRLEFGLYIPKSRRIALTQDDLAIGPIVQSAGEYNYVAPDGGRPRVNGETPFAKWVVGFDYTIAGLAYLNVMWVHGMPDELGGDEFFSGGTDVRDGDAVGTGAQLIACSNNRDGSRCAVETLRPRLGDYLVFGVDTKLFDDRLLLRLFTIWDLGGIDVEAPDLDAGGRVRTHYSMFTAEGFSAILYPEVTYNFGHGFSAGAGFLFQLGRDTTKFGDPAAGGSLLWSRIELRY